MKTPHLSTLLAVLVTILVPRESLARYGLGVTLGGRGTNRAYFTSEETPDFVVESSLSGYLESNRWGLYYKGRLSMHTSNNDLTSHGHAATGERVFLLGWKRSLLGVGLSAGFPHHRLPQGKPGQELRLAPTAREACPKWNPS